MILCVIVVVWDAWGKGVVVVVEDCFVWAGLLTKGSSTKSRGKGPPKKNRTGEKTKKAGKKK